MRISFVGLAIVAAMSTWGCDQIPAASQVQSFQAPLALPTSAPLAAAAGLNPTGVVTMTLTTTVDKDKNITAATATFSGNFSGFPIGSSLTSAHVNSGAAGVTGPVVIDLGIQPGQVNFLLGNIPVEALEEARALADEFEALLVFDEVQTGRRPHR